MKFPFIKLEYYAKKRNPVWVDIRTIAQVYEDDAGITRVCTTTEEQDFPVWDSVNSIMKRIAEYYDDGIPTTAVEKKSSFFDDYNV